MNWLYILIGIAVVVFIIVKSSGGSTSEATESAIGAGFAAGSCMLQIFLTVIGFIVVFWIFGALLSVCCSRIRSVR